VDQQAALHTQQAAASR